MPLTPADCVLLGLTGLLVALGLFRGFSGAFAFAVATSLAIATAVCGWNGCLSGIGPLGLRVVAACVVFVVVFGVTRIFVKAVVGKLLAQPADAIFGVLLALGCGGYLFWAVVNSPFLRGHSFLAQEVHAIFR